MSQSVKKLFRHWDKVLLVILAITYAVVFSYLSVQRHNAFASYFDLSNMDNTIWNTLHGRLLQFRLQDVYISRLSIHTDFILALLTPLYIFWNNVRGLLIFQSVALSLGTIPLYALSQKVLKNKIVGLTIVALYLLNPGMQWTNIYDFHAVSLAIPLLLCVFYFAYVKNWKLFAVFTFLALIAKEEISLFIMMIGFYLLIFKKERKIGLATALTGLAWFIVMVYVVIPYFSPDRVHWAFGEYQSIETVQVGEEEELNFEIPNLSYNFLGRFLEPKSIDYYNQLIKPFGYMPVLGLPYLSFSVPEIIVNVLSSNDAARTIRFHYDSGVTPSLAIATIFAFLYLEKLLSLIPRLRKRLPLILYVVCLILLLAALRVNYHYSPLPTTPSMWNGIYDVTKEDKNFEKALQSIPKNASVTASIEVRPHVNHRGNVYFIPSATNSAQFIALITNNRLIGNYEPKKNSKILIPYLLGNKNFKLLFKSQHFYLFERIVNKI